jgi:hypothetical protein
MAGGVFKCNGVYQDTLCEASFSKNKMEALATGHIGESSSNDTAALQLLIDEALAERDYRRAEELAVTSEQRQQIVQTRIIETEIAAKRARRTQRRSSRIAHR